MLQSLWVSILSNEVSTLSFHICYLRKQKILIAFVFKLRLDAKVCMHYFLMIMYLIIINVCLLCWITEHKQVSRLCQLGFFKFCFWLSYLFYPKTQNISLTTSNWYLQDWKMWTFGQCTKLVLSIQFEIIYLFEKNMYHLGDIFNKI